ncbi:anti sigma factor C-terminal domain-containing protein [Oceanirhabdus sp. W0125-5]|uniref:anti sigma factor C-terminal domain-containing protein n=1 Tax=Oceanirhabdus sp. W0125-5 TaxID=2999116 RepID=UPI0022F31C3A|nr:anti sigma factor C-terminal domain-containing protein [Oceanirhabdus sp. W0125-5]WBW97525.1 anti sigma factor C-terminal domain-containing protein [Oceanirhabdus sp. W0125-5]
MKCSDVRGVLPEYISELCSESEKKEIEKHLDQCEECKTEYNKLINIGKEQTESYEEISRKIRKVRRKLNVKILATFTITMFVGYILFNSIIPSILYQIRRNDLNTAQRAIVDFYQFTSAKELTGSGIRKEKYNNTIMLFVGDYIGSKFTNYNTIDFNFDLIKNRVDSEFWLQMDIIHPDVEPKEGFKDMYNTEIAKKILKKNGNDTVARVNLSFNDLISYERTVELLNKYDIKIIRMNIESGSEKRKIKYMENGANQHFSFGIPGQMLDITKPIFEVVELNTQNSHEYKKSFLEELKFLNEYKYLLASGDMRKRGGYENDPVKDDAKYILDNGIKVYGIKVTGPSDEIFRLIDDINPRFANVEKVDFWYWDK